MVSIRFAWLAVSISSVIAFSGCCGPMACGPMGCGPVALGGNACSNCDGCSGCGELYIDPWINHPPDCCDPCDRCGNFNGQSCGKCRPIFGGLATLWGYRQDGCNTGCNSCATGCDSGGCSTGGCSTCGDGVHSGGVVHHHGEPTMAGETIVEGPVHPQSYAPQHSRKIFRDRGPVVAKPPVSSNY